MYVDGNLGEQMAFVMDLGDIWRVKTCLDRWISQTFQRF